MKLNKKILIGYKLFFSLLGFSAVITEIATITERGSFNPVNFFSYFTIETNILVFVTLLLSAIAVAMGKNNNKLDVLRSAATVYILIVGIGFSVLLAGIDGITLTAVPWDNVVLHYIMPVIMFIDFLVDRPISKISFKKSLLWLLFPIAYVIYSLSRGVLIGWYPYPFLNPDLKGYGSVALTAAGLLVLALGLTWIVTKLLNKRESA